ncbi:DUF4430 domain-containing protein [Roseiconus nitratireducens]|nr:DUF4430 domain-containing protein [Roseiconus nitratireducens]
MRKSIVLALTLASCLIGSAGCESPPPTPPADAATGIVAVEILQEDAPPRRLEIPDVADGTTLAAVMQSISEVPIEISGSGSTAFVQSIGDRTTEGTKGWTFKIDGQFVNRGVGQTTLHPPTTVQWSYGEFEM